MKSANNDLKHRFVPALAPDEGTDGDKTALWVVFNGQQVLTRRDPKTDRAVGLPRTDDPRELSLELKGRQFLGHLDGVPCWAAQTEDRDPAPGLAFGSMRGLFYAHDQLTFGLAGRALGIIDWDRNNRFCGRCGAAMEICKQERAKDCPECGLKVFPRLSPAVIVLVRRGDSMLLGRSPRFPEGMHSTLAGFVEPGETLEECVTREIREEVGVEVADITYFGSQHWPMPDSLMIGFTARWQSGEIQVDGEEIASADWFTKDRLPPKLPGELSIARALIDDFLGEEE